MPCSGRWGAHRKPPWLNKPQLMPDCSFSHLYDHLSGLCPWTGPDCWQQSQCWLLNKPQETWAKPSAPDKAQSTLWDEHTAAQGADQVWPGCVPSAVSTASHYRSIQYRARSREQVCSPCSNSSSLSAEARSSTDAHLHCSVTSTVLWLALLTVHTEACGLDLVMPQI